MIDLQPSAEQQQIIDSVAAMLADRFPLNRLRDRSGAATPSAEANHDAQNWLLIGEQGVFGLGQREDQGGVGYGIVEEVLVAREFGRFLVTPSIIATMLAAHLAQDAGRVELAAQIRAGAVPVAQAIALASAATLDGGAFRILDGFGSNWTLVSGKGAIALVPATAWADRHALPAIDPTVTLESAELAQNADCFVSGNPELELRHRLLASAYLVGIAEAALADSIGYVTVREQFGQPIGAFQAIKHRCADMLARASAAWNLTLFAALCSDDRSADANFQCLAAKIIAGDAASRNAATNLQNHGGIGFTREHNAHLFVKRAHMFDLIGGSAASLKVRLLAEPSPLGKVAENAI